MEIQQLEDWSLRLCQATVSERVPLSGTIEITCRCNLRCHHCYNNLPLTCHIPQGGELSTEEHCRILDEITAAGCLWLLYTGGEIFVRKDFIDIYTYAKQKGLLVTLFTNGTLMSPQVADYLAEWRPYSIEVSLYGRSRKTYERVTGVPGSYDRCLRGIRLLMKRRLPLKLKTLVTRLNKHELWEMKQFAEEDLGVEFRFDAMINPRIDCSPKPLSLRLTPQEVVQLDLQDHKRAEEWRKFCQHFHGAFTDRPNKLYQCGGGISTFTINSAGMMGVCVLSRSENYDIQRGHFREGWDHFLWETSQREIRRQTKCVSCEIHNMCGMCPPNGELENEDAEEPVDFLCQVAHLRAYALGISVGAHGECEYCPGGSKYQDLMQSVEAMRRI
jgi:radical SAM protein with 4Fe4S-binding SPASM domain